MSEKKLFAKTVNIIGLIEQLNELYHLGIDYIDIYGTDNEEHDELIFMFNKEYMNPIQRPKFEEIFKDAQDESGNVDISKLDEDDINKLL